VPEIEMPAHVSAALAAYPQFSCTGGPFTVPPGSVWPITDIYCAGNDSTFLFLQDVLTEVMDLFPGQFIHIGGDEATKTEWETCPKCQARRNAEGLASTEELQSYFIRRIETFIVSKGRRLIGWDEILEGGLAPEATVMSWRGVNGGLAAARAGHDAVMTPGTHCYFDFYQGPQDLEPLAIGGYTPLSKVYSFEPIPDSLSKDEAKHILGAQANVWTEYIPTPEHAQYMTLPRMAAMSEVLWSPRETRDWSDFSSRVQKQLRRYEHRNYTYARSAYAVNFSIGRDSISGMPTARLSNEMESGTIRYSLDGSVVDGTSSLYERSIPIGRTMTLKAAAFNGATAVSPVSSQSVFVHKALGRDVAYETAPYRYTGGGPGALTNGIRGSLSHNDGKWLGFQQNGMAATVDLGSVTDIGSIAVTTLQKTTSWIFFPVRIEFQVGEDTTAFRTVAMMERPLTAEHDGPTILEFKQSFQGLSGRYVRVIASNTGVCPPWHSGAGQPAWVFADEIVVE